MNNIMSNFKKEQCCGCSACVNTCPKNAINMKEDELGFLYPEVNALICNECGLCIRSCSYKNSKLDNLPIKSFVAQSTESFLYMSASGGVFATIAKNILQDNGVVYGVELQYKDKKLNVHHIAIEEVDELRKIQGSKYVQSNIGLIFKDIKKNLKNGRTVLFSGTPCQVDGLKGYLQYNYKNLYCIDLICHGVPSEKIFRSYVQSIEMQNDSKVVDFKFRDKSCGWGLMAKAYFSNKTEESIPVYSSSYYEMFLKSYIYRINCYSCKYACKSRAGDVTIGDFWGIEKEHKDLLLNNGGDVNEKLGVSCIIVNTQKGVELLNKYSLNIKLYKTKYDKIAKYNRQLNCSAKLDTKKRELILGSFMDGNYEKMEKAYYKTLTKKEYLFKLLKKAIPLQLIKVMKYNRR